MSSKMITDIFKKTKRTRHTAKALETYPVKQEQKVPSRSDEEILRDFDLALEYGPCIGITRLERWQRAQKHGLNPPPHVRDIILNHSSDDNYTQCLWKDYNI